MPRAPFDPLAKNQELCATSNVYSSAAIAARRLSKWTVGILTRLGATPVKTLPVHTYLKSDC